MFDRRALLVFVALVVGCGPSGKGGDDDDDMGIDAGEGAPGTLRISPGDVILDVTGGVAATQTYTAVFTDDGGDEHEVTAQTDFAVDDTRLGEFDGFTFTSATDRGGSTTVRGSYQSAHASAN